MSDELDNLVLVYLRRIDERLDRVIERLEKAPGRQIEDLLGCLKRSISRVHAKR